MTDMEDADLKARAVYVEAARSGMQTVLDCLNHAMRWRIALESIAQGGIDPKEIARRALEGWR